MATPAQLNANRANALLSTGPRSVEGKAASSRNATKFGIFSEALIIPGEDPAELDALTAEFEAEYIPETALERTLLGNAVRAIWVERRCARIEAEILRVRAAAHSDSPDPVGAGVVYDSEHGNALTKIHRRMRAAQRDYAQAFNNLVRCQTERKLALAEAAKSVPSKPEIPDWLRSAPRPAAPPAPPNFASKPPKPTRETPENLALRL